MISISVPELLSIISLMFGGGIIVWAFRLVAKIAEIETKLTANRRDIDIVFSFLFNRAKTELVNLGFAELKSPIELKVNCAEAVMPFLSKFIPFYAQVLKKYPNLYGDALDKVLFIEFEAAFGDFIVEQICVPMQMNQGACLLAIIKSCQQMQHIEPRPVLPGVDPKDIEAIGQRWPGRL